MVNEIGASREILMRHAAHRRDVNLEGSLDLARDWQAAVSRDPSPDEAAILRLSSKSHWDVPIEVSRSRTVHFLTSHPTPPVFDGPERRNLHRNHDELRLWRDYITPVPQPWLCDDAGTCGGLPADARFVILGDLNNDPIDGAGDNGIVLELLEHPRVLRHPTPRSEGAVEAALAAGGANLEHRGAHAHDTANFGPRVGNLRVDYVLPSTGFSLRDNGVYWPKRGEPGADLVEASDHRLVWVDLAD
jgi:endonuclease/exonuclease/phosphatase family metal-dependent hydrolase